MTAGMQCFVMCVACVTLLQMLDGNREWAQLMAINASDPHGWAPGHTGPTGGQHAGPLSNSACLRPSSSVQMCAGL